MGEVTIKYKNQRVLEILKDLTKYFDFSIVIPERKKKVGRTESSINGVTIVLGDPLVNTSDLTEIFTGKNYDAGKIREEQWKGN